MVAEEEEAAIVVEMVVVEEEIVVVVDHPLLITHRVQRIRLHLDNWLDQERVYYGPDKFVVAVVHRVQYSRVVLA